MISFKLNCAHEQFNSQLKELTIQGSADLFNSPFRALYFLKIFSKKPFLGYAFNDSFRITPNTFLASFYIITGELEIENGDVVLSLKIVFSKITAIFLFIWLGSVFGLSLYFLIQEDYAVSSFLFAFGLVGAIISFFISHYTKKRDIHFFKTKLDHLITE